jgi:hypothetical protein
MKLTVHITLSDDDDTETVVREVFALTREALTPDTVGLGLAEAKDLLAAVQDTRAGKTGGGSMHRRPVGADQLSRRPAASWLPPPVFPALPLALLPVTGSVTVRLDAKRSAELLELGFLAYLVEVGILFPHPLAG